jgi:hypothetical protein
MIGSALARLIREDQYRAHEQIYLSTIHETNAEMNISMDIDNSKNKIRSVAAARARKNFRRARIVPDELVSSSFALAAQAR